MPLHDKQLFQLLHAIEAISNGITVVGTDNIAQVNGQTVNVGTGAAGTGTMRVAIASDSTMSILPTGTASGTTRVRSLTTNSTATVLKASAGNVYGWNIVSNNASTIYVKIYNKAAGSVNPASDVPIKTLMVPANGSVYQEPNCIQTSADTALSIRAVTDFGDTGTTAPANLPIIEFEIL